MKNIAKLVFIGLLVLIGIYLVLPSPRFPAPPPGSLTSIEPADTESVYRRAYFTNLSRAEILDYYSRVFFVPGQFRLNYPPEEAFSLVRDQTRSSFLEEIVHMGRESLYVNGFEPTLPTEQINRDGIHYRNKVTVRYVPSHPVTRLTVLGLVCVSCYLVVKFQIHV